MRRLAIVLVLFAGGCSFVESDGSAFNDARSTNAGAGSTAAGTSSGSGSTTSTSGSGGGGSTGSIDPCAGVSCPDQPCMAGICADGGCVYSVTVDATCDDANPCTSDDQCQADGGCAGVAAADAGACDDGDACTANDHCVAGICAGSSYTCTADANACQAASACDGDGGCIVTLAAGGTACADDSNPCTSDVCDAGVCDHPAVPDSPDGCGGGLSCSSGTCQGVCVINGSTYQPSTPKPTNECQSCQPGSSTSDWSYVASGTPCTDAGNPCAVSACNGVGVCDHSQPVPPGQPCGTGLICDGLQCKAECDINNGIYAANATDAPDNNPCLSCQPSTSTSAWSAVASGTSCTAGAAQGQCDGQGNCKLLQGQSCSSGAQCQSGSCNYVSASGGTRQCTGFATACASCFYYTGTSCSPINRCATTCGPGPQVKYCDGAGNCASGICGING